MKELLIAILLLAVLAETASAASWGGFVTTNTNSWQISRQSSNITMDITSLVEGTVSPVDHRGRVLSPYASYSQNIAANAAVVSERTAALQGKYTCEEILKVRSRISSVGYEYDKPEGTDVWTAEYYANWPITINSSRRLDYIGQNINNREYTANGEDNLAANFLYNVKLVKEQTMNLSARSLNATILATDDAILQADLFENKDIDYSLQSHSTGIADLRFKQSSTQYSMETGEYKPEAVSEERYSGEYNIVRKIRMRSNYTHDKLEDDMWLPCCSGGEEMDSRPEAAKSAASIFDCTCYEADKKS
ncbi:MAG TPA: hypothetical protein PLJ25_00160 [Methanothrix sp.]|nr:hypothetical protein [Methanothrix sp.]